MKSSSFHSLNADKGLTKWPRRLWYFLNWLNNSLFPNRKSSQLSLKRFQPDLSDKSWQHIHPKSSPSRALSDLFWMQLPWSQIAAELGQIHILDTGCGSGRYGIELQKFSGGLISSYTGLDDAPRPNWPETMKEHPFIRLQAADSASFVSMIPAQANLFVSQSAIEHFPEDLTYFRQLRDFIAKKSEPVLQIHLFPSAACLRLYRFHGVRQYTSRTVSQISSLFPKSSSMLFELGGGQSNALHWDFITEPNLHAGSDRRETETEKYGQAMQAAIQADTQLGHPSFYALVIHSNKKTELF